LDYGAASKKYKIRKKGIMKINKIKKTKEGNFLGKIINGQRTMLLKFIKTLRRK